MMWVNFIKRTAVRRVVWILVGLAVYALLALFGVASGEARAACDPANGYSTTCDTRQEALAFIQSAGPPVGSNGWGCTAARGGAAAPPHQIYPPNPSAPRTYTATLICQNGQQGNNFSIVNFRQTCAAGAGEWRDELGRCFDPAECLARNQEAGYGVPTTRAWKSECVAGCTLSFAASGQGYTCTNVQGSLLCSGSLEWSGEQCDLPPGAPPVEDTPPERDDKATCTPAPGGQSFCIKPNGEQCYTTANGQRQLCWMPTETGEKSDQNTLQKRNPGPTEIAPSNMNLPTGDVLEKVGQSIVAAIEKVTGNTTTSTTTTTTNYETQFGTNPGSGDEGEPSDGSGTPGGGDGQGDEDKGSVDGGGDCDAPPVGRGGDPQVVAIVNQAWATRCAVEAGNAAKVTGDVGDCKSPFSVEGTNANAEQLRAMRASICGHEERAEAGRTENEGISQGLEGEISAMESEFTSIFGDGSGQGEGSISTSRYGVGGSCPVISIEIPWGGTWSPPPVFCDLIAALRLLFLAITTIWALRIIGS